ncbi:MAG: regulation of enolase protein 1 (concanavalin A-like superfamily), partial [Chlamydiales bacterium]
VSAMDVMVTYAVTGSATDPDDYTIAASPLTIMAGQLSANIVLTPVDDMLVESSESVIVTLTGATNAGLGASLVNTATLLDNDGVPLVSDDFNQCALAGIWTLTDPQGDVTVSTRGPGSDDAQLVMSIPAGTHDPFNTITAPRLTQVVPDNDFEIEVKFDSLVTGTTQDQGVLILEDELNWLRFDFFSSGTNLNLFAASTVAGTSSTVYNAGLGMTASPTWMRINRTADQWTLSWSLDGSMYTQATSFSFAMNVSEAGVYVGNAGPAHTMVVDYVFETSAPVVPEDGAVIGEVGQLLTVNITGSGSVTQDPDAPLYYCSDDVVLTAVPDTGWAFDHWEMDLTGSVNPETVMMSADRSVTAVFVLDAVGPVISNVVVTPSSITALVTWTTDEPSTSVVDYGEGNLALQTSDGALVTSHSITLTGLTAGTMYQYQVTSADSLMQATSGMVDNFTTTSLAGFASDDFNHPNLDLARWTLTDPLGDGELSLVGSGTADAQLVLVAPAGGTEHAPWTINDSVRVMQATTNGDMQAEVKFESNIDTVGQVLGIAIEEAPDTWIRFDFHFDGVGVSAFAAGITSSVVQVSSSGGVSATPVAANTPLYMRVTRVGDMWTQEFSFDAAVWTVATSFVHVLSVNNVGVFAGNEGGTPPRTEAVVDYFVNTNLAPTPEDSGVPVDSTEPFVYTLTGSVLSESSVQLQWASDEPASATVNYGLTQAFELGAFDTYPVASSHSAVISGLLADTLYYFEVVADDGMGNQGADVGPMLRTYPAGYMGFPLVDVWYGQINGMGELAQPFGHLGMAQTWVNVVGKVRDLDGTVASLTYELNGSGQLSLSMGLNRFPWRLSGDGDFNVEIATSDLAVGKNEVVLRATDNEGKVTAMLVRVDYTSGVVWASTYSIDWSTVTDVMDVAQVVDGKWRIEDDPAFVGEKVIRTEELGYDRILVVGDVQWENYEVNFQMTANALDPDGFTASSNSFAIGCILRWEGHVTTDAQQPRVGFDPIGGLFAYRWFPGNERWDHYGTGFTPNIGRTSSPVVLGVTYLVKGQVETMPDDTRVYRLKSWERGTAEPGTWLYEVTHTAGSGLDTGSFLLLSNHVDASFGNISVAPLP